MSDDLGAWGWVEHLRGGGTTRWRDWVGRHDQPLPAPGRPVPGAQRLEVLRRLNELGDVPAELTEAVLHTTSLGRGQQERRLTGAGSPGRFGAPAVAPAEIPVSELCRVATGALTDLSLRVRLAPRRRARRPRWRRPRYRLAGDALLAAAYDEQLRRQGRPPGGRDLDVLLLVAPLDLALVDAWAQRVLEGGRIRWAPWLERSTGPRRLPEHLDSATVAARWAARRGRDRVHVVTSAEAAARLTGGDLTQPRRLSHAALEAVRATSTMLNLAVPEERHRQVVTGVVVPWVVASDRTVSAGPPPRVPASAYDWVSGQAERVRDSLRVAGYPVHGDGGLDAVRPLDRPGDGTGRLSDDTVLLVLLGALRRAGRSVADETGPAVTKDGSPDGSTDGSTERGGPG